MPSVYLGHQGSKWLLLHWVTLRNIWRAWGRAKIQKTGPLLFLMLSENKPSLRFNPILVVQQVPLKKSTQTCFIHHQIVQ